MNNWKTWLYGLVAAAIGGFASALLSALAMPDVVNFTHDGEVHMIKLAIIGAVVPVLTLLKQSPLPPLLGPGDKATVQNPIIGADGTITGDSATLTKAPAPISASKNP